MAVFCSSLVEGGQVGGGEELLRALLQVPATRLRGLFAFFRTWLQGQVAPDPVCDLVSPLVHLVIIYFTFLLNIFFFNKRTSHLLFVMF